jgi:hyperosmotically inducible protein
VQSIVVPVEGTNVTVVRKIGTEVPLVGACLFLGASASPRLGRQNARRPTPDNSKTNQRDQDKISPTFDQQKLNRADRDLTKQIRAAIHSDKSLSTYAHTIKIIARRSKVTLKGSVRSDQEKAAIDSRATETGGAGNATNQLGVAPPKS